WRRLRTSISPSKSDRRFGFGGYGGKAFRCSAAPTTAFQIPKPGRPKTAKASQRSGRAPSAVAPATSEPGWSSIGASRHPRNRREKVTRFSRQKRHTSSSSRGIPRRVDGGEADSGLKREFAPQGRRSEGRSS
ncbi:unnamed protein product, partial [Ectocarpus fasciculatus]